jgi:hypothetical protein
VLSYSNYQSIQNCFGLGESDPHLSALTDHPIDNKMEEEYLMRALIESVRDELKMCQNDEEIPNIKKKLEELLQQASLSGLDLEQDV